MKLRVLATILACFFMYGAASAQGITLDLQQQPLQTVFKEIKAQAGTMFLYSDKLLEGSRPVTIRVNNAALKQVLDKCFDGQPVEYSVRNGTIVVRRRQNHRHPDDSLKSVSGIVTHKGQPLPGVSVSIKNNISGKGTVTDNDGLFRLQGVAKNDVIVFSSVGFQRQEVMADGSSLHVELTIAVGNLDETVIIGYGKTTKRLNTGALSKISSKDMDIQPVSNVVAALSGRMAGVFVTQQTGVPGGGFTIQIRGRNSLRPDGNNPLYIVDGVPVAANTLSSTILSGGINQGGNPLSFINHSDIESIEILKDGDATAIYGSRGANGVVLITTKKGSSDKTSFDINYYEAFGKVTRLLPLLNTQQYLAMREEAFLNDGITPGPEDYDVNDTWQKERYTNWQKELLGNTARRRNIVGSLSGGVANTHFLLSGTYAKETSVFPGDGSNQRATAHLNVSHSAIEGKLKINLSTMAGVEHNNLQQLDLLSYANTLPPNAPALHEPDGSLNWENSTWDNPLAELERTYRSNTDNLLSNLIISYTPVPGLTIRGSLGYNTSVIHEIAASPTSAFRPSYEIVSGSSLFNDGRSRTWIAEPEISYRFAKDPHQFHVLAGSTLQESESRKSALIGTGFVSDAQLENMQAASDLDILSSEEILYRYVGLFARLNYTYDNKILLNLTGRRDGSSRFAPGKQYGTFGAIGAGWIFSQEKFFADANRLFSFGKIRTSYGTTGSDQIGDYQFLNTYTPTPYAYQNMTGFIPSRLFNPNFHWEINKKWEAALELGFFKDKLLITVAHYRNTSSSQLVGLFLAPTTGFRSVQANLPASVRNTGTEIELTARIVNKPGFTWSTVFNFTRPLNKLVGFPNLAGSSYANVYTVGRSLNTKKAIHYLGVDPQLGYYRFEDVNGNGNERDNPGDLQSLKEVGQNYYGGWQHNITWNRWSVDFHFQYVDQTGYSYLSAYNTAPGGFSNQPTYVLDRWREKGSAAPVQVYTTGLNPQAAAAYRAAYSLSDLRIVNSSFVRLKNLHVGYSFSSQRPSKKIIENLRLYLQAQNLITITGYQGNDPENHDSGSLPPLRMIATGIQVTF